METSLFSGGRLCLLVAIFADVELVGACLLADYSRPCFVCCDPYCNNRSACKSAHGYRNWIPVPIAVAGAALFLFWITPEWNGRYFQPPWHTLMFSIFKPLDSSNFRVATTEAGLIPLALDEGQSLDTYVHNTRKIALEGEIGLQTSLEDFRPNILVVHGPPPVGFVDDSATCPYEGELWSFQQRVLYDYAEQNSFDLVLSDVRGPCDTWNVFANSEISEDSRVKIASPGNPW